MDWNEEDAGTALVAEECHHGISCFLHSERQAGRLQDARRRKSSYAIIDCNDIIDGMASITIRNLEETTKRKLKVRAAMHGRSMEQEARDILNGALREKPLRQKRKSGADLVKRIREIFEPLGGVELEPFPREPMRDPDWLKDWKE